MPVSNELNTSGPFAGNGISVEFSYTFRVENKNQLSVFKVDALGLMTELVVDSDYTVGGIGTLSGAITMGAAPLTGEQIYIISNYQETQLVDFESQGGFFPSVHAKAFDKLTYLIQQLDRRTVQLPVSVTRTTNSLPEPQEGYGVKWDANGDLVPENLDNNLKNDGSNTMEDDLDMNGFRILNLPPPAYDNDPVRLKDIEGVDGGLTVAVSEEVMVTVAGQVDYTFSSDRELAGSAIFIRDPNGDNGAKLLRNYDYDLRPDIDAYTLTLRRVWEGGLLLQRIYSVAYAESSDHSSLVSLESVVYNATTGLLATNTLAQNATPISAFTTLNNAVTNGVTGLAATNAIALAATPNTAFLTISNAVNDPTTGLANTNSIALAATPNSTFLTLQSAVNDGTNGLAATFSLSSGLDTALGAYRSTAQLTVDVDGNLGLVQLDGTATLTTFKVQTDLVQFLDDNGVPFIEFDVGLNKASFLGAVYADEIIGDTAAGAVTTLVAVIVSSGSPAETDIVEFTVSAQSYAREVFIPMPYIAAFSAGTLSAALVKIYKGGVLQSSQALSGDYSHGGAPFVFALAALEAATFKLTLTYTSGGDTVAFGRGYAVSVFRASDQITFI
jgi:hypothetical protein